MLFLFPVSIIKWTHQLLHNYHGIFHTSFVIFIPAIWKKCVFFVFFLSICARPGEGVCELRYRTGTDLLCVITSLCVPGEIFCNIILKCTFGVWEKLSECSSFGLLTLPPPTPRSPTTTRTPSASCHLMRRFAVCKLRCQLIKIAERRKNVNARSRLSLSVRPRASPSPSAGSLLPPDAKDSSGSASGHFLFIDRCVLSA